jgi:putative membrane protein
MLRIWMGFVALQHVAFLVLEMFLFDKSAGLKMFAQTAEEARIRLPLAQNQGLYNGFLAAGLVWGLIVGDPHWSHAIGEFFFGCVLVAGIFGGVTAKRSIIVVQGLPAAIGLALVFLSD